MEPILPLSLLHVAFLSVLQGITEFLPISSSAHLVFPRVLLGWAEPGLVFDITVHAGTLLAVLVYFRKDVAQLFAGLVPAATFKLADDRAKLIYFLAVATVPIIAMQLLLGSFLETIRLQLAVLGGSSIVFGVLLWLADKRPVTQTTETPTLWHGFLMGLWQAFALIPGTSRSGACVTGGRFLGFNRQQAGRLATLMAIPTLSLAAVYGGYQAYSDGLPAGALQNLLVGFVLSFITAMGGIHLLMTWLARVGYTPFVMYRVMLGVCLVGLSLGV